MLPNRRHLFLAPLGLAQQLCPLFERHAALPKVIMAIVRALDTAELVPEASFGHLTTDAERRQVRARRPAQVVRREMCRPCFTRSRAAFSVSIPTCGTRSRGSRRRFGKT